MDILRTVLLFVLAGLAEISGAYLVWQWRNEGRPAWFALLGLSHRFVANSNVSKLAITVNVSVSK